MSHIFNNVHAAYTTELIIRRCKLITHIIKIWKKKFYNVHVEQKSNTWNKVRRCPKIVLIRNQNKAKGIVRTENYSCNIKYTYRAKCTYSLFCGCFTTTIYCNPPSCPCIILPHVLTTKQIHSAAVPLSAQITAAQHAIKTDCGVGVAAVGNTCCDILVMVGDPASEIGNTLSSGM